VLTPIPHRLHLAARFDNGEGGRDGRRGAASGGYGFSQVTLGSNTRVSGEALWGRTWPSPPNPRENCLLFIGTGNQPKAYFFNPRVIPSYITGR
jgi:hypothetical protein